MTVQEFFKGFTTNFPDLGKPNGYLDTLCSAVTRTPHLDIVALDDALIAKHGAYKGSMAAFVTKRYGKAAADFIRKAI